MGLKWEKSRVSMLGKLEECMELEVCYVAELYEERGSHIFLENNRIMKPHDLLYLEVKGRLKKVLADGLSDLEIRFAEADQHIFVVCNVMGLEDGDPGDSASWVTICGIYAGLPKTILTATREESENSVCS
jgi:hypothetical protein